MIFLRRQTPPNIIRIKPVGCHKAPFTALMFFHNYVNDRLQGQNQSAGIFDLFSGQLMKKSALLFSGPSTEAPPQICLDTPQFGIVPGRWRTDAACCCFPYDTSSIRLFLRDSRFHQCTSLMCYGRSKLADCSERSSFLVRRPANAFIMSHSVK